MRKEKESSIGDKPRLEGKGSCLKKGQKVGKEEESK
jgi:hypothetical protein